MKLIFISNLFPDESEPVRGLDNATLLSWLNKNHDFECRVISPRSVFPPPIRANAPAALKSRPSDEFFKPVYPNVGYVPRMGSRWNDRLMARGLKSVLWDSMREFHPDLILSSWLFPDGCAVADLCGGKNIPVALITQGTDTHQYLEDPIRRQKIVAAIKKCEGVICRSGDLSRRLYNAGVPEAKLRVIYNGIDTSIFCRGDKLKARQNLGIQKWSPLLLFVGNFLPVKNPLHIIQSHAELNKRRLAAGKRPALLRMIGDGPMRGEMKREIERLGTEAEAELLGRMASPDIANWMNAADVFCLSSRNEGFPNVLLESMACGLPIVSTNVGGISEKLTDPTIGRLVAEGKVEEFVEALEQSLSEKQWEELGLDLSWGSAAAQYALFFREIVTMNANSCRAWRSR
ncbi:glycosyltransferase [Verrucomicrobiales bacterium]|nr:glycosyltransferase [Verrucomicrobiales bacterium]MDC0275401.1 glycosyltransferase [Verrucomicrobiales bacterium]